MAEAFDWQVECPDLAVRVVEPVTPHMQAVWTAVHTVVRVIDDEGPYPPYHRGVIAEQRREWPTLWRALDELRNALRHPPR